MVYCTEETIVDTEIRIGKNRALGAGLVTRIRFNATARLRHDGIEDTVSHQEPLRKAFRGHFERES